MNETTSDAGNVSEASLVGRIADEFLARLERGEQPRVEEYVERHPRLADVLRHVLSALQVLLPSASDPILTDDASGTSSLTAGVLGDFRISRQIGRGGMGVVYEAEQLSLGRRVALKVLPFAAMLDPKQFQRFKNEAQAAAGLHHPNIVPVYAVGCERGVHHYAMQYVDGLSLAELLVEMRELRRGRDRDAAPPSGESLSIGSAPTTHPIAALSTTRSTGNREYFQTVARLGIQAASALEHAHQVGVVHRDIKPGNLLADLNGNLWVTDFGLARFQGDTGLTITGDFIGTLRYMSPEQALGKPGLVDHRTDIYSLGATLYELLTLEPAHRGRDREELLREITELEPEGPRRIDASIPLDLETIVLKAMAHEPAERYASAAALADDLQRYLECKPILARPPGVVRRAARLARRHAPLVSLTAATLLLVAAVLATSTVIIARQRNEADAQRLRAETMAAQVRQRLYAADMKLAYQTWRNADVQGALDLLERHRPNDDQADRRGFEWYFLTGLCENERARLVGHAGEVYFVAFAPDGTRLASASQDGTVRIWDATSGRTLTTLHGHSGEVTGVAFSPDGKRLASAGEDRTIRLWDVETGQETAVLRGHNANAFNAVFSPDGKLVASGGPEGVVKMWDTSTLHEVATFQAHSDDVEHLAFSPDGRLLATAGGEHFPPEKPTVKLWDTATCELNAALKGHTADVQFVTFAPDGSTLASASSDQTIKLWDVSTGRDLATLHGHSGDVHGLAFSADGATLASASRDGTVRLWDRQSGRTRQGLGGHRGRVWSVAFSPDGRRLATAGADGTVRLWNAAVPGCEKLPIDGFGRTAASLSPDGKLLATWDASHQSKSFWQMFNATTGDLLSATLGGVSTSSITFTTFTADSKGFFTGQTNGTIAWRTLPSGAVRLSLEADRMHTPRVGCVSPDGRWLADALYSHVARLWDASTGKLHGVLNNVAGAQSLAFSPDGRALAIGGSDGSTRFWDPNSRQLRRTLSGHRGAVNGVVFSPDGSRLATASEDFTLRVWDTKSEQSVASLSGHSGPVYSVAFSPDGKTLASGSEDKTVRLWHVATGQELLALEGHERRVTYVAFYPDGRRLLSVAVGDDVGEFVVWSAADQNGEPGSP